MAAEDWELTGIRTVEIPCPRLIRIRVLWDLFPGECFNIEHVNVGNHPTLCDEATSLDKRSQRWTGAAHEGCFFIRIGKPWNRRRWWMHPEDENENEMMMGEMAGCIQLVSVERLRGFFCRRW